MFSRTNKGGLNSSKSIINQGDFPTEINSDMDYDMDNYVKPENVEGSLEKGVSFAEPMYPHDMLKKTSDY